MWLSAIKTTFSHFKFIKTKTFQKHPFLCSKPFDLFGKQKTCKCSCLNSWARCNLTPFKPTSVSCVANRHLFFLCTLYVLSSSSSYFTLLTVFSIKSLLGVCFRRFRAKFPVLLRCKSYY